MATKKHPQTIRYKSFVKGLKLQAAAISRLDFENNPIDQNEILIRAEVMQAEIKEITKIVKSIQKEQSKF